MVTVKIKHKKSSGDSLVMGSTELFKDQCLITIFMDKNKDLATYASTLIHELMHLWLGILKFYGLRISKKAEHAFIDKAEKVLIKQLFKKGN